MKFSITTILFLACMLPSFGQEIENHSNHEEKHLKNSLSYFTGMTYVPSVHREEVSTKGATLVSSAGLSYIRVLGKNWGGENNG